LNPVFRRPFGRRFRASEHRICYADQDGNFA